MDTIVAAQFVNELEALLTETFESVQGIYLDRGTSLFETLAQISAEQASIPVGKQCASIAAQTAHVNFYLETLAGYLETGQNERVDWGEVWRTVRSVTPEEWAESQQRLRETYQRVRGLVRSYDHWEKEDSIGGAMAIVAHTAYHLGEIRQATCIVT